MLSGLPEAPAMTPRDILREAITATGLSDRAFARVLAVDERTVRRWIAVDREIPGPAVQLCRAIIAEPSIVLLLG